MSDANDSSVISDAPSQDEAAWCELMQRSRRFRDTGNDEEFIKTALLAFRGRPHRAEPLHDLAQYYLGKSRGDLAIVYADAGMSLPFPEHDRLGVEEEVYRFKLKEAFVIAASYSKDPNEKERGRVICYWLSLDRELPYWTTELARRNSRWFTEPVSSLFPSIRFHELDVTTPDGYTPGNVSLARVDGGFLGLIRAVNYDRLENGTSILRGDTSYQSRCLLIQLDRDLQITGCAEVMLPEDFPPPRDFFSLGFEDPRPLIWRDELWCVASILQMNNERRPEMILARIARGSQGQRVFTDWRILESGRPPQWEKNWMPQVVGDELQFIYSVDPTRVLSPSGEVILEEDAPIAADNFHGGSQAVPFDDGWLMLVHEMEFIGTMYPYFHRFIWLDQNNKLARVSRRFFFRKHASEFAAGLTWHTSGDRLIAGFVIDEHFPTLAIFEAQEVRAALLDVDEYRRACERACEAGKFAMQALLTSKSNEAAATIHAEAGEYEFTVDWFSYHIPVWQPILSQLMPTRILEIGSFEGRSTCYLIETCSRTKDIEIFCIDTWEGGIEHDKMIIQEVERRFDRNVAIAVTRAPCSVSVKKLKQPSLRALGGLFTSNETSFDFIYVDGSHQAADVLADSVLAFQLLRIGGVMIFDDYLWRMEPEGKQDMLNMPKPAIDAFINLFQRKLRVIQGLPNFQVYVEKLAE